MMKKEFVRLDKIPANIDIYDVCEAGAIPICVLHTNSVGKRTTYANAVDENAEKELLPFMSDALPPGYYQLPRAYGRAAALSLKLGETYAGEVITLSNIKTSQVYRLRPGHLGYTGNEVGDIIHLSLETAFIYRPHLEKYLARNERKKEKQKRPGRTAKKDEKDRDIVAAALQFVEKEREGKYLTWENRRPQAAPIARGLEQHPERYFADGRSKAPKGWDQMARVIRREVIPKIPRKS